MATKVNGKPVDPVRKFRYEVYTRNSDWLPKGQVGFTNVSGLGLGETEDHPYADGNDMVVRKLPGRTTYGDVTLKKGIDVADDLARWRAATNETLAENPPFDGAQPPIADVNQDGTRNALFRADLIVELYDRSSASGGNPGKLVSAWEVRAAWPKSLMADELAGQNGEVLYETCVISTEQVVKTFPKPRAR